MTIQHKAKLTFRPAKKTRKTAKLEPAPEQLTGRVPRVARLLALAHRFERLVETGVAADYADLARLGHVTRARVTQIMNLLALAPDIQEQILCWPPVTAGKDPVPERGLTAVVAEVDWKLQRQLWIVHGNNSRVTIGESTCTLATIDNHAAL
jgi:hypothetical protein